MKIIVAEDDPLCSRLIRAALIGLTPPEKIISVDTLAGLVSNISDDVHAIWLDLVLKDAGAMKTLGEVPIIRHRAPGATLVVASGWGDAYREQALAAGADAYVSKEELRGFKPEIVSTIFIQAATSALQRSDVKPGAILAAAARWVTTLAQHAA